jgi:hypothetical protein
MHEETVSRPKLERVRGRAAQARRPDHLVLRDGQPPVGGKPGGQRRYSDIAIEAALTVRAVYGLAKRCRVYYLLGFNEKVPGLFSENKPGTFSRHLFSLHLFSLSDVAERRGRGNGSAGGLGDVQ